MKNKQLIWLVLGIAAAVFTALAACSNPFLARPANTVTVTFDSNWPEDARDPYSEWPDSITITKGTAIGDKWPAEDREPEAVGYRFTGWEDEDGEEFNEETKVTKDITVYAGWRSGAVRVTFNANGGTVEGGATKIIPVLTQTVGNEMPDNPIRARYAFEGWWRSNGTTSGNWGTEFTKDTRLTASAITVWAKWVPSDFTVTFNANGGQFLDGNTTQHGEAAGGSVTLPSLYPIRTGYRCIGWSENPNATTADFTGTGVTRDMTVNAVWQEHRVTVKYYKNDPSPLTDLITTTTIRNGDALGNMPPNPTSSRTGFTFERWSHYHSDPHPPESTYTASYIVDIPGDEFTLYARWVDNGLPPSSWTVTLNPDGGSVSPTSITVTGTGSLTIAIHGVETKILPNASRPPDTFMGWTYNGGPFDANSYVTGPITITARYELAAVDYNVTFVAGYATGGFDNGNIGGQAQVTVNGVPSGTAVGARMPGTPTLPGMGFRGWYTQMQGGGAEFTATTPVTTDTIVYANYGARTYGPLTQYLPLEGFADWTTIYIPVGKVPANHVLRSGLTPWINRFKLNIGGYQQFHPNGAPAMSYLYGGSIEIQRIFVAKQPVDYDDPDAEMVWVIDFTQSNNFQNPWGGGPQPYTIQPPHPKSAPNWGGLPNEYVTYDHDGMDRPKNGQGDNRVLQGGTPEGRYSNSAMANGPGMEAVVGDPKWYAGGWGSGAGVYLLQLPGKDDAGGYWGLVVRNVPGAPMGKSPMAANGTPITPSATSVQPDSAWGYSWIEMEKAGDAPGHTQNYNGTPVGAEGVWSGGASTTKGILLQELFYRPLQ